MAGSHFRDNEPDPLIARPLALVGMMGSGKSTIGRRLARKLGVSFIDSDHEIELAAGRSINEIFADFGEEEFRNGERRVMKRLVTGGPCVLATGGGSFLDAETRQLIMGGCITVWLNAKLDTLVERTSRKNTRPLLLDGDPRKILADLLEQRGPIYAEAQIEVQSGSGPHDEVVARVMEALEACQYGG